MSLPTTTEPTTKHFRATTHLLPGFPRSQEGGCEQGTFTGEPERKNGNLLRWPTESVVVRRGNRAERRESLKRHGAKIFRVNRRTPRQRTHALAVSRAGDGFRVVVTTQEVVPRGFTGQRAGVRGGPILRAEQSTTLAVPRKRFLPLLLASVFDLRKQFGNNGRPNPADIEAFAMRKRIQRIGTQ
jgi:hypothetical protein